MIEITSSIIKSSDKNRINRIKNILSTPQGSVPYDRDFGFNMDIIDKPINEAKALAMAEIIRKIRKYEIDIVDINITFNVKNSKLIPLVVINDE